MDIICLSSDSEDSTSAADAKFEPPEMNADDVFLVDWNDEVYPAVDYNPEQENTVIKRAESVEKIEDFIPNQMTEKPCENDENCSKNKHMTSVYDISDFSSSESEEKVVTSDLGNSNENYHLGDFQKENSKQKTARSKQSQEEKKTAQLLKEQKKLEREKLREEKKREQQRQKALKAVIAENQRNLKPEENIKFLKVHIDNEIINSPLGGNLIMLLQQNNIQFVVEAQKKSRVIMWSKKVVNKELDDFGVVVEKTEFKEEEELIYIIEWEKAVNLIHQNELLSHVETIRSVYSNKKLTVIIFGLEKYFNFWKSKKNNESKGKNTKLAESERPFKEAPRITKDQLEFALTDLQLWGRHNCRLLETPEELSGLVFNITKSLSQLDYKLEKEKRREVDLDWFARGDSCQSVKVDKNGIGLINLWQQQICNFHNVGLETAQAIVSQYNSPLALVNKYDRCESEEGEILLQNIQIRRDLGLLSSTRRVGPQLSKKIYKFFTSEDPNLEL